MLILVQIVHNKPLYTLYAHEVKSCKTQQILDKATKKAKPQYKRHNKFIHAQQKPQTQQALLDIALHTASNTIITQDFTFLLYGILL